MAEKIDYQITINAPVEKVWKIMLEPETYKQWTAPFGPTSYYEGSWDKGSKIKFLSVGGDGMSSEIAENIPYKFISIKHVGIFKNGVEDTTSPEAKEWTPSFENYLFMEKDGQTELKIDLQMEATGESEKMKEMFQEMWPKALEKLKELCEKQ